MYVFYFALIRLIKAIRIVFISLVVYNHNKFKEMLDSLCPIHILLFKKLHRSYNNSICIIYFYLDFILIIE